MNYWAIGIGGTIIIGLGVFVWRTYNDLILKRINVE